MMTMNKSKHNTSNNMNKKEKLEDMSSLLKDGYGMPIENIKEDFINKMLPINHVGGATGILDVTEALCEILMQTATIISSVHEIATEEGFMSKFENLNITDFLDIDIRYMQSDEMAGFHFAVHQKNTGVKEVDIIVGLIIKIFSDDKYRINKS